MQNKLHIQDTGHCLVYERVCACVLDGRGAGIFKTGHHPDWTVYFHLTGEGNGKAEASLPAVPST